MKKLVTFLFIVSLSFITSCSQEEDLGYKAPERTLNFYALNDFHGAFLYDEESEQAGLSRIGNFLIEQKENDPENTFILSSGDMFQGGAESNITRGEIVIEAMNEIGFDSMTIGNHEFDWGEDVLKEMASQMEFPFLGINVFYEKGNNDERPSYLAPSTIVKKEGIKVGIIGSIMQNIDSSIIATIAEDFYFAPAIDMIEEEAKRLKNNENCDIVVLSTHDGAYRGYKDLENVDAVFLGHEHDKLEGKYDTGVPYVEGLNYGTYLSHISLDLKLENNHYKVVDSSVENIDTFSTFLTNSPQIDTIYSRYEDEISAIRDEILYTFDLRVSKNNFGRYIAKSLLDYANQNTEYDVSMGCINSGGGVRDNILPGEFTYGDLIKVYPFENVLAVLKIKPEDYGSYYSRSGLLKYYHDDTDEPIINSDGYVYIATIDYVAYQNNYTKEEIIPFETTLCRDIVATNLKTNGYSI